MIQPAWVDLGFDRRKRREFEQKVAKEAKVWVGNCAGPEFILESRFQERGERVGPEGRSRVRSRLAKDPNER